MTSTTAQILKLWNAFGFPQLLEAPLQSKAIRIWQRYAPEEIESAFEILKRKLENGLSVYPGQSKTGCACRYVTGILKSTRAAAIQIEKEMAEYAKIPDTGTGVTDARL